MGESINAWESLAKAFGPVGALFLVISGLLLRELITEYKERLIEAKENAKVTVQVTSVMERVINVLEKKP